MRRLFSTLCTGVVIELEMTQSSSYLLREVNLFLRITSDSLANRERLFPGGGQAQSQRLQSARTGALRAQPRKSDKIFT